jgi:hypothetical protein
MSDRYSDHDKFLVRSYFSHPRVVAGLAMEGYELVPAIDWEKGEALFEGKTECKVYVLDEMLPILRDSEFNEGPGPSA